MKRNDLGLTPARMAFGALLTPLLPPVLYYAAELWAGPALKHVDKYRGIAMGLIPASYIFTLVFLGLLVISLLAIKRLTSPNLLLGGFLVAGVPVFVLIINATLRGVPFTADVALMVGLVSLGGLLTAGLFGLLTAGVFALLAGVPWRGRPLEA